MTHREPLVSVIVRSMDRESLHEALNSIREQTWPFIEILVVNAKGVHQDLSSTWGPHSLKVVSMGHPLSRSEAANLGLKAAQGKYASFLDDDDLLFEDHLGSLVSILEETPDIRAIYSGVRVEVYEKDAKSPIRSFDFNEPFKLQRLRGRNYIPIHAMLFERSLITQEGCSFDETLDIFEDWDFWLQLSQHTPFLHLNNITALYRNQGGSGLGEEDLEKRNDRILEATAKVLAKWIPTWTPTDWAALVLERDVLTEEIVQHDQERIFQLEKELVALRMDLQHQKDTVADVLSSSSWKITQPLRVLARHLKSTAK